MSEKEREGRKDITEGNQRLAKKREKEKELYGTNQRREQGFKL